MTEVTEAELAAVVGLLTEVRGDVKLLLHDVVGNGNPGLLRRMTEIEKEVDNDRLDKQKQIATTKQDLAVAVGQVRALIAAVAILTPLVTWGLDQLV